LSLTLGVLEGNHILRLRTFLAISDGKLDFLAVRQSLEALAFDGAEVDEDIRAICSLDKIPSASGVRSFSLFMCNPHERSCSSVVKTQCSAHSTEIFVAFLPSTVRLFFSSRQEIC